MDYDHVTTRLEAALGLLPAAERPDAERLLVLARKLASRARTEGRLLPAGEDPALRREIAGLVERLSRRSSKAVPSASLGRALLADLSARPTDAQTALGDCRDRLSMFGL